MRPRSVHDRTYQAKNADFYRAYYAWSQRDRYHNNAAFRTMKILRVTLKRWLNGRRPATAQTLPADGGLSQVVR